MPLNAVLFDMDGVIVDTEPLHHKAYYSVFSDLNITVSPTLYASFTGCSTQKVCESIIAQFNLPHSWSEIAQAKRRYFKTLFDHDPNFDLIPGVKALIEHYYAHGITLILASSAHMNTINWVFERFELEPYFKGKISGAALSASKPHPEIFEKAAAMAKTPRKECLVIEDSTNGILAAHRAGILCAAYQSPHTQGQDYTHASLIVSDFQDLKLEKLEAYFN